MNFFDRLNRRLSSTINMKNGLFILCLLLAVSGISCSRKQAPPQTLPEVATITVARQPVLLTTELPGRTSPCHIAEIRPQVNGLIQKRLFTEGSDVQAGQELYQIDPAPFQAALDSVQATLPALRSKADRFKECWPTKRSASRTSTMRMPH